MNSKAVLEFVVLLRHQGIVLGGQGACGEDGNFFVF